MTVASLIVGFCTEVESSGCGFGGAFLLRNWTTTRPNPRIECDLDELISPSECLKRKLTLGEMSFTRWLAMFVKLALSAEVLWLRT